MQAFGSPGEEEGIVKNALNEKRSVRHEGALHSVMSPYTSRRRTSDKPVSSAVLSLHDVAPKKTRNGAHHTPQVHKKSRTQFVRRDSSNSPGSQVRAVHLTLKTHGEVSGENQFQSFW